MLCICIQKKITDRMLFKSSKLSICFIHMIILIVHETVYEAISSFVDPILSELRSDGELRGSQYSNSSLGCSQALIDSSSTNCNDFESKYPSLECNLGQYLDMLSLNCKYCPAGRFGNTTSLIDSRCSGLCDEGFYCLEGSTSPREFICSPDGDPSYYCPENSAYPLKAAAGYYTINSPDQIISTNFNPGALYCLIPFCHYFIFLCRNVKDFSSYL